MKSNNHQTTKFLNNEHPSNDSLYESEYDSSSTLDSSSSTTDKAGVSVKNFYHEMLDSVCSICDYLH